MARRIIIPARYASTRLPQKMLLDIAGKPMLQHVWEKAVACRFDSVLIATDDARIAAAAKGWGAEVCMTDVDHPTGTDRLAEAFKAKGYNNQDVIVGVQGDEPLIPVENIIQVAENCERHVNAAMTTLCERLQSLKDIVNPNYVKVVRDKNGYAMYFSRAPIPWDRAHFPTTLPEQTEQFQHVGIYCYRGEFLQRYATMERSPLEHIEALEQLRVLWHGLKIHVDVAQVHNPPGVDTLEGLERVRKLMIS
jgi:3-deoxy-manno-octulosonate cytidylyltransferase (CMP-KDO synthetase)